MENLDGYKVISVNGKDVLIDPSTYRQVEKNAIDIATLLSTVNSDPPDINIDINNPPDYYETVITYEVKSVQAVRLNVLPPFAEVQYAVVQTYRSDSPDHPMRAYQQAYAANSAGAMLSAYRVENASGDGWTAWAQGLAANAGGTSGGSTATGPNQPADDVQKIGDVWLEPITPVNT